jgi:hypothetical protein
MRKFFAIWIFKPVVIMLWLIHLGSAYVQGRRCSMGCNPTVDQEPVIFIKSQPHFPQPQGVADAHFTRHWLMTSMTPVRRANHANC